MDGVSHTVIINHGAQKRIRNDKGRQNAVSLPIFPRQTFTLSFWSAYLAFSALLFHDSERKSSEGENVALKISL